MHPKSTPHAATNATPESDARYPSRACAYCDTLFTSCDKRQRFCSRPCVWADARAKLNAMRDQGNDPTKGGTAADARRASLARRRAAGEPIGRAAAKAKREGTYVKPFAPPPLSMDEEAAVWLALAHAWDRFTARALEKDKGRTLVLAGHGAGVRVDHDTLIVRDGRTHDPQEPASYTLHRAVHGVEHIAILADSGSITFDALRWCRDQRISVLVIDRFGGVVSSITPDCDADATLRRRQYAAVVSGQDVAVARWLIARKIAGQRDTLACFPTLPGAAMGVQAIDDACSSIASSDAVGLDITIGILTFEGRASAAYFQAWAGYPLQWKQRDRRYVPPQWLTIQDRHSPLSDNGRRAVDPVNALLNYAYGVLDGQCYRALVAAGFDTACGFLHADKQYRDSLVYDVMELYRAGVDTLVLALLTRTTFTLGDFTRTRDGVCKLHPQLARAVVAACRVPDDDVAAGVAALRALLLHGVVSPP